MMLESDDGSGLLVDRGDNLQSSDSHGKLGRRLILRFTEYWLTQFN